jgi:monofunctional biosynthetic peptidoglycan transglycosylase
MRPRLPLALAALLAVALGFGAWVYCGLPRRSEVRELARRMPGRTALMRQRAEEARRRGRTPRIAQTVVPLSRVSRHLIQAVVASEDQRFFGHEGVDWEAIQDSLERNLERRRAARGGSTITQQLAKNLYFGTERTLVRKLRELVVARWLEDDLSKARILTLYLNVIEWGDGIYGCEAAARHWYGRSAEELSLAEAAGLAAMIPNPRRIDPQKSPARHERARRRVLWLMGLAGYIARDVSGLGAEPTPEPAGEAEADEEDVPSEHEPERPEGVGLHDAEPDDG